MKDFYKIQMVLEGKEYTLDYEKELALSEEMINEQLRDQPSLYAYYAVISEVAESVLSEKKLKLDFVNAQLDERYRKELEKVKSTETMIRNKIIMDEDYLTAVSELNEAKKNAGLFSAVVRSFEHRKDCVIALASNMRVQAADPSIFVNKIKQENLVKR